MLALDVASRSLEIGGSVGIAVGFKSISINVVSMILSCVGCLDDNTTPISLGYVDDGIEVGIDVGLIVGSMVGGIDGGEIIV